MFVKDGYFWHFMPMLSPDDAGGTPADSGDSSNEGTGSNDVANEKHDGEQKQETENEDIETLKAELARYKKSIDKNAKEAAEYKRLSNDYLKQLRAKQTAEEIAAEEKKAQDEAQAKEIEELRREVARAKTVKNVMAKLGTDEEVSGKISEYLYGAEDIENALAEIQRVWAAKEKALRLEYGKVPAPGVGGVNGEDAEMQKAIKLAKELGRERAQSGKSLKERLGGYVR